MALLRHLPRQVFPQVLPQVLGQSSRRRRRTCRTPASRPAGRAKSRFSASPAAVFSMKRPQRYLRRILEKHGMWAKVGPAGALTAGRISRLSAEGVRLVCLSYFDANLSTAGARFAVRRLRWRLGEVKILAGFWQSGPGQGSELCAATKADFCATRFKEALAFCLHKAVEEAKGRPGQDRREARREFLRRSGRKLVIYGRL